MVPASAAASAAASYAAPLQAAPSFSGFGGGSLSSHPSRSLSTPLPLGAPSLSAQALSQLGNLVQLVLPLGLLQLVPLCTVLGGATVSDARHRGAVQAASVLGLLPTIGLAALDAPASATNAGPAALTRLVAGLLWVLEHAPHGEGSSAPHPAVLSALIGVQQFSSHAALRTSLLAAGALRIVSRVAVLAWTSLDTAGTGSHDGLPVNGLLAHALDALLALTNAPIAQATSPFVATLLNRLGACIITGPSSALDTTSSSSSSNLASTTFVQALALLGNFCAHSPQAKSFVKSNTVASAKGAPVAAAAPMSTLSLHAASPSPSSTVPLKALYRQLISFLSSSRMALVLHSLRLVAHLAVNDAEGGMERKLFAGANLEATFQLVFNLIIQNATPEAAPLPLAATEEEPQEGEANAAQSQLLRPAIDILLTLTQSTSLLVSLKDYSQLTPSLRQLVRIIGRTEDPRVAAQLLELLTAFAKSQALAPILARLLRTEEECLEILASAWFARDVAAASLALRLVHGLAAGDDSSATESSLTDAVLRNLAPATLASLARFLSRDSFLDAARADAEVERDSLLVEATLQDVPLTGTITTPFIRTPSVVPLIALPASASPSTAASSRGQTTHHSFLVLVAHFFIQLAQATRRAPQSRSNAHVALPLDAASLQHVVRMLVQTSFPSSSSPSSPAPTAPSRHEEVFALLRLLSLLPGSPSSFQSFLLSLPPTEVSTLLGAALATCEHERRATVADALEFVRMWTEAHATTSTVGDEAQRFSRSVASPSPLRSKLAETSSASHDASHMDSILLQLAEGLQSFNRSSSRDSHRMAFSLASVRSQLAAMSSSFHDLAASHTAAQATSEATEQDLRERIRNLEAQHAKDLEQKDQAIRDMKASHAHQSLHFESALSSRLSEYHASQQAHFDRFSSLESELHLATSRATQAERALAELQTRYKVCTDKLRAAGEEYERTRTFGEAASKEAVSLRTDLVSSKAELQAAQTAARKTATELAASQASHQAAQVAANQAASESRDRETRSQARTEDAYAKLVLLDRALRAADEDALTRQQQARDAQLQVDQLSGEISRLRSDSSRTNAQLQRATSEVSQLGRELASMSASRSAIEASLGTAVQSAEQWEAAASSAATRADQAERRALDMSSRLEAADAELKQHHQLAAMIHKLSGSTKAAPIAL